MQNLVHWKV